ncbi:MAG: uroporphyrinogen-III synthase [Candidatus Nanopelagicales bacterium]
MTTVLLPRPAGSDADEALLVRAQVQVFADPYIEIMPILDEDSMSERRRLASRLPAAALVITSARALSAFADFCDVDRSGVVYAIGRTSAAACRDAGFSDVRVPEDGSDNVSLTRLIAHDRPATVVVPRSSAAASSFLEDLAALGLEVCAATLYTTSTVTSPPQSVTALAAGVIDAVVVRSGSAARALASFVPQWPDRTRVVAAGRATALVLRELGIPVSAIAVQPDSATVVATTLNVLEQGEQHD